MVAPLTRLRSTVEIGMAAEATPVDVKSLCGDVPEPSFNAETGAPNGALQALVVCREPRMTLVPSFLTKPEADHLLALAEGYWAPSLVGRHKVGADADGHATAEFDNMYRQDDLANKSSQTRTSRSCMLRAAQTSVVERIEHRLAALAGFPVSCLERLNMVRYAPGEVFGEHHDGRFRPTTVFVYVNDLPEGDGGETHFPQLNMRVVPRAGCAVMWRNNTLEGGEDDRLRHAALAPLTAVKYGVNCFFNVDTEMRLVYELGTSYDLACAGQVDVGTLAAQAGSAGDAALCAFMLSRDPKLCACPGLLTQAEAALLLDMAGGISADSATGADGCFSNGSSSIRCLGPGETETVARVEARIASVCGCELKHLGPLRVTWSGRELGLCNRGCGQKSALVCLSEQDRLFFPHLGLDITLRRGDLLTWPNADWSTGKCVEDLRTLRVHIESEEARGISLDAFFFDAPIREQQAVRPISL